MTPLLPLEDALASMLDAACPPPDGETQSLSAARNRVLADDVLAPMAVPPEDNSAMDGYALRVEDLGGVLPVSQRVPAGSAPEPLVAGTAARIFTGAPIPPGANAVVMQENARVVDGGVEVTGEVRRGDNIRPRGQDITEGSVVLRRGQRLRAADLGLLASLGMHRVPVYRPLRVALLCTGSELVPPGQGPLHPGQIYDSNRYMLTALLESLGMQVRDPGIVADTPADVSRALCQGAAEADCILASGGVSVGEEDHVRAQVEALGELLLWRLAIKPGKPLAFGRVRGKPFIGLPGNPTSSFVTFCLLARPFLQQCQGELPRPLPALRARAGFSVKRPGDRRDFRRVRLEVRGGEWWAYSAGNQSSGVLSAVSQADALAVVPEGTSVAEGDWLEVRLLAPFG